MHIVDFDRIMCYLKSFENSILTRSIFFSSFWMGMNGPIDK